MIIINEINGRRGVMISEKVFFDLEGRCSIQLSYGRSGWKLVVELWTRKRLLAELRRPLIFSEKPIPLLRAAWRFAAALRSKSR